jgi:2'-5' RNA ligase
MSSRGSLGDGERLRLFVAFPLPEDALRGLTAWQRDALGERTDVRVVPEQNLHATIAFLGNRPAGELEPVTEALREAARGAERPMLTAKRYRETRSVGMVVFDDEEGRATRLAEDVHRRLHSLGVYEPERRAWLPHVTVVRFRQQPKLSPPVPVLGPVSPSDVAVYISRLRPTGAQYEVLESVALGG